MQNITAKFGGSSLASAEQFRKVANIIKADPARRYIVASAPGKRDSADTKVTDMLYKCYDLAVAGEDFSDALNAIRVRFDDIATELGITFPLDKELETIAGHLRFTPQREYMASRGEYLNSMLLAAYLGYKFIDAARIIIFNQDGSLDKDATYSAIHKKLDGVERAVIPGFYGIDHAGVIRTFSRGGSDVTGAIVARGVGSALGDV